MTMQPDAREALRLLQEALARGESGIHCDQPSMLAAVEAIAMAQVYAQALEAALAAPAEAGGDAQQALAADASRTLHWRASEADEANTRMRVCRQRRKLYNDHGCERDGSCDECTFDVARHHETEGSKQRRKAASAELARLRAAAGVPYTHRHKKRGTLYRVLGNAGVQVEGSLVDEDVVVVYQGEDGKLWARAHEEFHDGRFEALAAAPAPGAGGGA